MIFTEHGRAYTVAKAQYGPVTVEQINTGGGLPHPDKTILTVEDDAARVTLEMTPWQYRLLLKVLAGADATPA